MHKQTIPIKIPIKTIAESRGKNKQSCTVFMRKHSLKEFQRASAFQRDTITRLWPADLRRRDGVWSQTISLSASVIPSHYFQRAYLQSENEYEYCKSPTTFPLTCFSCLYSMWGVLALLLVNLS